MQIFEGRCKAIADAVGVGFPPHCHCSAAIVVVPVLVFVRMLVAMEPERELLGDC